jgi:RimJ/RimL family protein N-acetyltransferase
VAFGEQLHISAVEGEPIPAMRMGPIERQHLNDLPPFDNRLAQFLHPTYADQLRNLVAGGDYLDYLHDSPDNLHWGLFAPNGRLIGMTGFRNMGQHTSPIMRIALLDPSYMGQGYGNSATFGRTIAAHEIYNVTHNVATINDQNTASLRAAARFGYVVTAHGDDRYWVEQYHPQAAIAAETVEHTLARDRLIGALGLSQAHVIIGAPHSTLCVND